MYHQDSDGMRGIQPEERRHPPPPEGHPVDPHVQIEEVELVEMDNVTESEPEPGHKPGPGDKPGYHGPNPDE